MSSAMLTGLGVGHCVHLSREPRKDCERAVRPGRRRRAPGRLAGAGYRAFYQPGPRVGGRSHGGDQRPHRRPQSSRSHGRLKGPERRRHGQRNDATLCCGRLVSRHVHIPSSNQNMHVYTYINIAQLTSVLAHCGSSVFTSSYAHERVSTFRSTNAHQSFYVNSTQSFTGNVGQHITPRYTS
ncbi:hypothetical protein LSAT2_014025 [Lamellibrachia satsuma]|nr:hypothetical protein LSAT2_014025 [Lamellibrachia satsuma]